MNVKIKHRILGILVIAALGIILFPFFQNKNMPTENTVVKAPPFPNPETTISAASSNLPVLAENNITQTTANNLVQPDDTISSAKPVTASNQIELPQPDHLNFEKPNKEKQDDLSKEKQENLRSKIENAPKTALVNKEILVNKVVKPKKSATVTKPQHKKPLDLIKPTDSNGLANLNRAVWVIQIGNFKNKSRAVKLVNRLRMKGYPAFIQQISTTFGNSTRVFVGPAYKQAAANELADHLEKHIHIHGIVLSYKPLTL